MKEILGKLKTSVGVYEGEGINHEGQPFAGTFTLKPLLDGRGFYIQFVATGKDGTIYHKEESTIAPSLTEKLTLWNFNTNIPGLVPHELRSAQPRNNSEISLVFGFNQSSDTKAFREEVALDIWNASEVSYTYSWGLPGGDFKERSGVRMSLKGERTHA